MQRLLLFMLVLFSAIACQRSADEWTPETAKAVADSARQMLNDYNAAVNAAGLTAEFQYLDHSPNFFWVPPGYTFAISYDSVATILRQNAPFLKTIDNAYDTLRIIPLSRELATYTARIRSTTTDTSGKVSILQLVETGLLIKRKDGWKLLNGQTSIVAQ